MKDVQAEQQKPIEDENIIRSGRLAVGDGHEIYWVDWGNKQVAKPIFYIHGGPGGGFSERDFSRFNPKKHRVIFHDQRGSGRSTPFASVEHNTTQDLIEDITKLRKELGFDVISLYGFSWGSTLSLLYAIAHPEAIEKMLIGGIFLARSVDNDFYLKGRIASHFPEVWERFESVVPKENRNNLGAFYKEKMTSSNEAERNKFAFEWLAYEYSIAKLDFQPLQIDGELKEFMSAPQSYVEAYYIVGNNCFIPENYIIKNAAKLKGIETVIVQGRYDFICMPSAAYDLSKALDNAQLHFVISGHSPSDTVQREVVRAYANMLWK